MSSPWAKIPIPEPTNLQDIILEEVVKKVQAIKTTPTKDVNLNVITNETENSEIIQKSFTKISDEGACDQDSDAVTATLLQEQFIEEYHDGLKNRPMAALNLPVYTKTLQSLDDEGDPEEEEFIEEFHDHKDWEQSETVKMEITKHDITLSYPSSSLHTSDETDLDLKFKMLKSIKSDHQKLGKAVLDKYSTIQICKMINQQMFKSVNCIIHRGEEAILLHAESDPAYLDISIPKECVLKVFNLDGLKKTSIVAEKEWDNLCTLQKAGIPCPEVVVLKRNILIMSFIGENGVCAPRLKDAVLTHKEYALAYNQVVEAMKRIYTQTGLFQIDLRKKNIFWYNKQCYFIGLGEAVEVYNYDSFRIHPSFKDLLWFFKSKGVQNVTTKNKLYTQITGIKCN